MRVYSQDDPDRPVTISELRELQQKVDAIAAAVFGANDDDDAERQHDAFVGFVRAREQKK
jgi:hypothetical protein